MIQMFLVALALVGLVDAISYMVVAPSIVFYVLENGGTKEQYGIILSAFSFASFAFKPLVGFLSDRFGFRVPYFATLGTAAFGGFIYFIADAFEGTTAVALILVGRLLGGIGASSAALGFAYLAKVVPHEEQTKTNSLLSMTRILGMASGPGFNILLAGIDTKVFQLEINSLNSVGLFIMLTNLISLGSIFLFLKEPDRDFSAPPTDHSLDTGFSACVRASMRFDILFPIYSIFAFNAAFQLIETSLAPAANHALGWTPVAVSGVLGSMSIVVFINMMVVFWLSARKIRDEYIIVVGSLLSTVGYFLIWALWQWESSVWHFAVPIIIGTSGFPFLAAPCRSCFTKAVDSVKMLSDNQGTMQAVLSMFASVAGFVAPGFIAAVVLRTPAQVESSADHRELSPVGMVFSAMCFLILLGSVRSVLTVGASAKKLMNEDESSGIDEKTGLIRPERRRSSVSGDRRYSAKVEVARRSSVACLGMVQTSMYDEHFQEFDDDADDVNP